MRGIEFDSFKLKASGALLAASFAIDTLLGAAVQSTPYEFPHRLIVESSLVGAVALLAFSLDMSKEEL